MPADLNLMVAALGGLRDAVEKELTRRTGDALFSVSTSSIADPEGARIRVYCDEFDWTIDIYDTPKVEKSNG